VCVCVCVFWQLSLLPKASQARFLVLGTGESRLGCPPCSPASVNGALQCDVSLPRSLHGLPATALQVQEHAASFSHTSHFDRSLAGRIKREFLAPLWLFEYSPSVDLGMRGELPFPCPIANNPASALCETPPEHTIGWPIFFPGAPGTYCFTSFSSSDNCQKYTHTHTNTK